MEIPEQMNDSEESADTILEGILDRRGNVGYTEESEEEKVQKTENIIKNANNKVLIEFLAPQIGENEKKKREHKDALLKMVKIFLVVQFSVCAVLFAGVLSAIIGCHIVKNPFNNATIKLLIKIITFYTTSVVIELICILRYIVTNVFDTSITGLLEYFKDDIKKE